MTLKPVHPLVVLACCTPAGVASEFQHAWEALLLGQAEPLPSALLERSASDAVYWSGCQTDEPVCAHARQFNLHCVAGMLEQHLQPSLHR